MYSRVNLGFVLGVFVILFTTGKAVAQSTAIKYLNINSQIISVTVYVAPGDLAVVTAQREFAYNDPVTVANISWTLVTDADEYRLEHALANSGTWTQINLGSQTDSSIQSLPLGEHQFRVVACGGGLCGEPSLAASLMIEQNLDLDLDGIADAYDLCLGSAQGVLVSAAGCDPSDFDLDNNGELDDTDNDGVTDDLDWCENTNPADPTIDARGCSQNQVDSDGDGTADYLDVYPYQHDTQCTG